MIQACDEESFPWKVTEDPCCLTQWVMLDCFSREKPVWRYYLQPTFRTGDTLVGDASRESEWRKQSRTDVFYVRFVSYTRAHMSASSYPWRNALRTLWLMVTKKWNGNRFYFNASPVLLGFDNNVDINTKATDITWLMRPVKLSLNMNRNEA